MWLENKYVEQFTDENYNDPIMVGKRFVFQYSCTYKNGETEKGDGFYSKFDLNYAGGPKGRISKIRCEKYLIDDPCFRQSAQLTPDGEFLSIDPGMLLNKDKEENDVYYGVFQGLWFDFPTPFKKGDIVWDPERKNGRFGRPFVLVSAGLEGLDEKVKEFQKTDGDTTDMNARGYFADPDIGFYHEVTDNYMDLEYYPKELAGVERTLIPLSSFLKGKIDIGLFARAYHVMMTEAFSEKSKPEFCDKKSLVLAGLKKPEQIKIWLDDVRDAPDGYIHCKSVNEAKTTITECEVNGNIIDVIDCDHDLGEFAKDGGDGIKLLDWLAERETYYPIELHTMNPVGRENMQNMIDRYWKNS